jgi:hypothetical protein
VSGVEEEEIHQGTASAGIVSRVEEEGSREGTTSDDIIASHISGAEEAAGEVPVYSVEQAHGDGPTFDEGNEIFFSEAEEIDRFLLMRQRYGGKWLRSQVNAYRPRGCCTFKCVTIQENGSDPSPDHESLVRSLKELEEAVEECNLIYLEIKFPFDDHPQDDTNDPELEVTEELIELVMRIDKDHVFFRFKDAHRFLEKAFHAAYDYNIPNLMKLVVGMAKSSVVCPMSPFVDKAAMDSAFMSCHTMPELLKLLLEFNPNFRGGQWSDPSANWEGHGRPCRMMLEYRQFFIPGDSHSGKLLEAYSGVPKDVCQCYSRTNRECTLQNLTNQWKLDAHLTGLELPQSKNFNQTSQKIEVQVLMEPTVLLNNSLTLKILNLKFHSHNAGSDANAGILSRFFLSGVALTATPEVDPQHFMFTKLGLGSANPAHDMLFGTTLGTSATVPLGKGVPTVGFTSTQTISLTSKSVTDWKHEQTHGTRNCHSSKSGTFSWTLKNLGGIPFDQEKPSYPRSFKKSRLELPFNEDGSVTFTDKEYPDPITWNFKPELEATTVVWRISMEVYVTILNDSRSKSRSKSRSVSAGKTLKFCFARHLKHKLGTD